MQKIQDLLHMSCWIKFAPIHSSEVDNYSLIFQHTWKAAGWAVMENLRAISFSACKRVDDADDWAENHELQLTDRYRCSLKDSFDGWTCGKKMCWISITFWGWNLCHLPFVCWYRFTGWLRTCWWDNSLKLFFDRKMRHRLYRALAEVEFAVIDFKTPWGWKSINTVTDEGL